MRAKLEAQQKGAVKYEVQRDPAAAAAAAAVAATPAPAAAPQAAPAAPPANMLPIPAEKDLTELQGRLWFVCFQDENVCIYMCIKNRSIKKQTIRVDLRCDKKGNGSVADVALKLPEGITVQEAEGGVMKLHEGALAGPSGKVKMTMNLGPFSQTPKGAAAKFPLCYTLTPPAAPAPAPAPAAPPAEGAEGEPAPAPIPEAPAPPTPQSITKVLDLALPGTIGLAPVQMSEDEVSNYIATHAQDHLGQQSAQALAFNSVTNPDEVVTKLSIIVAKAAGLCYLHGIQQGAGAAAPGGAQKFLLIGTPLEQGTLPQGARIVGLCAGAVKDGVLQMRVTMKSSDADISAAVATQFNSMLKELLEGRLKDTPTARQ